MIRSAASADEKRAAIAARDALRAAILGELVTLTVHSFDKYGRLLASVAHAHEGDMSHWMIDAGHARPYDGATRGAWMVKREKKRKNGSILRSAAAEPRASTIDTTHPHTRLTAAWGDGERRRRIKSR